MADFKLQYLKHGKSLCGKVFGTFVETFNRLVDFQANLKGDGDVSGDGLVTVDRADPAHPVIRLDRSKLPTGGEGQAKAADRSCFRLETRQEEDGLCGSYITCCYYHVGGVTMHMNDVPISGLISGKTSCLICFKLSGGGSKPSIVAIEEDSLEGEQRIADNYVLPLYRFVGGTLQDDLRNAPNVQQWEVGLT